MSIVIRRGNGDVLWFDAVLSFESQFTASVTKHPVATGGYISDHVIKDNVVLNISGVLTDADFNLDRPFVGGIGTPDPRLAEGTQIEAGTYELDTQANRWVWKTKPKEFTNNTPTNVPVKIEEGSKINKLLPEIVAQFTKDTIPTVVVEQQSKVRTAADVRITLNQIWSNREQFQVLDIIGDRVQASFGPCIFTSLSYREDETTGEGIFPVMTIEEVTYTTVRNILVEIRQKKTSNKGRKTAESTKQDKEKSTGNGGNAADQPTSYSGKSNAYVLKDQLKGQ